VKMREYVPFHRMKRCSHGARHNDDSGTSKSKKSCHHGRLIPYAHYQQRRSHRHTPILQCCEFTATLSSKTHWAEAGAHVLHKEAHQLTRQLDDHLQ
jgi:hypothetical protein